MGQISMGHRPKPKGWTIPNPDAGPTELAMHKKLLIHFLAPPAGPSGILHLAFVNESAKHKMHPSMNKETKPGEKAESHFHVLVVSDSFEDVELLDRNQVIQKVLEEELDPTRTGGVHALRIKARTTTEWDKVKDKKDYKEFNIRSVDAE